MSSEVQSILFDKHKFTTSEARKWMKKHGFKPIKRVDETKAFYRYRQTDPDKYKYFRMKVTPDIKFVLGFKY